MKVYKKVRIKWDGNCYPLFIGKNKPFIFGEWMQCEFIPTKGFADRRERTLRVATKFPRIAGDYFANKSRDIELIELHGSIELAPLVGLSDVIVDIVETGKTLEENGLTPLETVVPISARLIANKARYQFKSGEIRSLCGRIQEILNRKEQL